MKARNRSGRCEVCQKILENSLKRYKELIPGTAERATKSDSKVKLSALSPSQLLDRARNLSSEVRKLFSQNKALTIMLKKQNQKLSIPNFDPTFDELSDMVNFAVANKLLKQGSGNLNTSADPVDIAQSERCWNEIRQCGICN